LEPLDLQEVELDGRLSAEEGDEDTHLPLLHVYLVDDADEVLERPVDDAHGLAHLEANFDPRLLRAHLAQDGANLRLVQRRRVGAGADEAGDPGGVAHHLPGAVSTIALLGADVLIVVAGEIDHLHQDVAGEDLLLHRAPLAVADFDLVDERHDDAINQVAGVHRADTLLQVGADLVLVAGVGVDNVPGAAGLEDLLIAEAAKALRGSLAAAGLRCSRLGFQGHLAFLASGHRANRYQRAYRKDCCAAELYRQTSRSRRPGRRVWRPSLASRSARPPSGGTSPHVWAR